ncbi:MAG TPA: tetratricopeptide repeat protein [Thermoanaerobaculia bacterium]|jgi:TolB-like protein/Tfp pilus assembly protein PilF|nr:tetratricopeptide repeat protein [Thermoanaerobaculia bacterium]
MFYEFGRFRLDADAHVLFRDEKRIPLTPKAVDVLVTLVENRGAPVARQDLFEKVWSDAVVEDGTLSSHISLLRRTLGPQFIETIPKRGYRFVGAVEERKSDSRVLLAVLPFENLSGSKKHDCFSDGLTEEMITQLGRLNPERLGVIARTSSMTYKSTDKTIEQIGRELGVAYVLEGSARRAGSRVRISAQLIKVSDQTHVWAENYEGGVEDILSLQSRVSVEVARQIQVRLTPLENPKPVVPAAYEAYLKGRYHWHRRTQHDLEVSIRCFEEAVESDPSYAPAYTGIADSYLTLMDQGYLSQHEATAQARASVLKALRLDENLAEAHASLAHAAFHEFDWPTAESEFVRAIELNPSYSNARHYYSNYLSAMCRFDEAIAEAEEARRLDPVSAAEYSNLSSIYWHAGHYERAIEQAQKIVALNPTHHRAYEDLGRAYEQMGAYDAAIESFEKAIALEGRAHATLASLAHAYASAGKADEARKILQELQDAAKTRFVSAYSFALIYMVLGEMDEAFAWFAKAFDERSPALPFLRANPRFASMRGEPRFEKLIQRVFGAR